MTVLFVEHPDGGGPGVFGDVVEMQRWRAWCEAPPDPESLTAVVVFGGSHNVVGGPEWLSREVAWLSERLSEGVPVLGVCLGAQLLASALGASLSRSLPPEIGWHPAWLTDAGRADPVLSVFSPSFVACQWHSWSFSLPADASLLALSAACPQAFRYGSSVGVQFHPEVDAPTLDRWIGDWRNDPDAVSRGFDPDYARVEAAKRLPAWNDAGRRLLRAFLEDAA